MALDAATNVKGWTCRRVTKGARCGAFNPSRVQLCRVCGKRKPPRRRPSHLRALELPYDVFVELNGGEHCALCGRGPSDSRRLDRDHDHRTGRPRGLLCWRHNKLLGNADWTPELLRAAADYLERSSG